MTIRVDIVDNIMSVDATINKKKFTVVIKNALVKIIRKSEILKKVVVTKKVNELTKWQEIMIWLGRIMILSFIVVIIAVIVTLKNKFLGK